MFASRSVSSGSLDVYDTYMKHHPMPVLEGEVKELYEFAYGTETYHRYCDTPKTIHGAIPPTKKQLETLDAMILKTNPPCVHKPHHDVESLFWVLLYVLIHAQPLERSPGVDLEPFWDVRTWFHRHEMGSKNPDCRSPFFRFGVPRFIRSFLDPKLAPLAGLISKLLAHIYPNYDLFETPPPPEHLHEVMRRLLLKQIHLMKDPIALDPKASRPVKHDV